MTQIQYGNGHRLFLQSLLSHRTISHQDATKLCERISEIISDKDQDLDVESVVHSINKRLDSLGFRITSVRDQDTGNSYFVFVNTQQDELTQLSTTFSAHEISYFKSIMEFIFQECTFEFSISSSQVLDLTPPKFTKLNAEAILHRFVSHGWLDKHRSGTYELSLRALAELDSFIREEYAGSFLDCHALLHTYCTTRARIETCPSCKTQWKDAKLVGIGAKGTRTLHTTSDKSENVSVTSPISHHTNTDISFSSPTQIKRSHEGDISEQNSPNSTSRKRVAR